MSAAPRGGDEDPSMLPPCCHAFKAHVWAAERRYCAEAEALTWSEPAAAGKVPMQGRLDYAQLRRVRLRCPTGQQVAKVGVLDLWPRRGRRMRIVSIHFRGVLDVEDRAASYRDFVRALHAALVGRPPGTIDFRAGSTWPGQLALWTIVLAIGVLMLFVLVGLLLGGLSWWFAPVLPGMASAGWVMGRHTWRNRPRRYAAASVPAELLP
jgi:hypothetical protein